jgi:hypothetical protein
VVYVTVIAINAAGFRTISYSDPIMIDLTRPECKFVNDGPVQGKFKVENNKANIHIIDRYLKKK